MKTFKESIAKAEEFHGHICSGQCIGVKMANMGMRLIGIDNEIDKKSIMVFSECNRCPSDAIMVTTGCSIGKRTFYFKDLGKIAATFLNLKTGKAIRVYMKKHIYPPDGASSSMMIDFYDALPDEEFLEAQDTTVTLNEGDYPGPPVRVVICESCGEEVMDNRHVIQNGKFLCKSCAKKPVIKIPMYSFAGYSNTGKTTFIEKLITEFKSRGIRVGVLKHDSHGFEMDHEGKDTWRFSKAGADMVAIVSNTQFAAIENRGVSLEDAIGTFHDVDIIITEGYKFRNYPKIAVYRKDSGNELAGNPEDFIAIVTDSKFDVNIPQFPLDDPAPTADFIISHMKKLNTL